MQGRRGRLSDWLVVDGGLFREGPRGLGGIGAHFGFVSRGRFLDDCAGLDGGGDGGAWREHWHACAKNRGASRGD